MAKISGEAIPDINSMKWGYVIYHENGKIITKSEFIFNSQIDAEDAMLLILQELAEKDPT
jgi:hypothetical protein